MKKRFVDYKGDKMKYIDMNEKSLHIGDEVFFGKQKGTIDHFVNRPDVWGHIYDEIGPEIYFVSPNISIYLATKEIHK